METQHILNEMHCKYTISRKNKEYIQTMMEFQWLSSCGAEIQCPVVNFGIAAVALSERLLH